MQSDISEKRWKARLKNHLRRTKCRTKGGIPCRGFEAMHDASIAPATCVVRKAGTSPRRTTTAVSRAAKQGQLSPQDKNAKARQVRGQVSETRQAKSAIRGRPNHRVFRPGFKNSPSYTNDLEARVARRHTRKKLSGQICADRNFKAMKTPFEAYGTTKYYATQIDMQPKFQDEPRGGHQEEWSGGASARQ